jgi:RNAse (barnase) inhibitor barstar
MRYNPYKPGSIVHPGMFSGRFDEILGIEKLLFQTKNGNSSSFIITGERGIGKSSLLLYVDTIARGKLQTLDKQTFNFLPISISLEQKDSYSDVIYKLAREFSRELAKDEKIKTALKAVWDFITNWEVMGVKYNKLKDEMTPDVMLEELSEKVISVLENIKNEIDGIYFFIDEADKPIQNPNLGVLVKYLTERVQKKGINNFAFGIIGLPQISEKIKKSHESTLRILTPFPLCLLNSEECNQVIDLGLKEANIKNEAKVMITDDAKSFISNISEGYPHFVQQYCYSSFEKDIDNNIDLTDVISSLVGENGALHELGAKYFDSMFNKEISSVTYRKILISMASNKSEYISKSQIISQTHVTDKLFTNAINAFTKKGIITRKKGSKGQYKLLSRSFAVWILAFNQVPKNLE